MGTPIYINDLINKYKALPQKALSYMDGDAEIAGLKHLLGLQPSVAAPVEPASPPRNWQAFVDADARNRAAQDPAPDNSVIASVRRKYPNILGR